LNTQLSSNTPVPPTTQVKTVDVFTHNTSPIAKCAVTATV